jgi:hypothetical protein
MTDTDKDRIAALEREVAALKEKAKPPEPFVPKEPYQRYDPTANMSMPLSTLRDMCNAVPDHVMRGVIRDNRAPSGRPGVIPDSQQPSNVRPSPARSNTPGWVTAPALSNPPGTGPGSLSDKIVDEFDRRDRAELAQKLGALGKR